MDTLIAAIDESAAARAVVTAGLEIARLFGDELVVLTVCDDGPGRTSTEVTNAFGLPLQVRHGRAVSEIVAAAEAPDVRGVVLGTRGLPSAKRAVGSTALELIQTLDKPVVVVPPTALVDTGRVHRLLVPLDGTGETAAAVELLLRRLQPDAELDVVALHVFDAESIPAFSDQAGHEAETWTDEFMRRWLPNVKGDVRLETRVGRPASVVPAVARETRSEAVALAWKQNLSPGRAQVVTELIAGPDVIVVLLRVADGPGD